MRLSKHFFTFAVLALIAGCALSPAFQAGFIDWDDNLYVTDNALIKDMSLKNIRLIFTRPIAGMYHPLTILSFAVEYYFFGLNPHVYHITNVVVHIANTFFVFIFIFVLLKRSFPAFLTALLFAIHPMHVESVAWISERKDVLYAFFFLLALIYYVKFLDSGLRRNFHLCFVYFVLSCLSKTMAVTLPVVLLLIDFYKNRRIVKNDVFKKTHFFVLGLLTGVINLITQKTGTLIESSGGNYDFLMNFYIGLKGFVFYLWKLAFPVNLSAIYPMPAEFSSGELVLCVFTTVFFLSLCVLLAKKSVLPIFGMLFFLLTILPVLKFIPMGAALAADRYTYIPSIGIFLIFAVGIDHMVKTVFPQNIAAKRLTLFAVSVTIAAIFGPLTYRQTLLWQNSRVLFSDTIGKYPAATEAYTILAKLSKDEGRIDRALELYKKALSLRSQPGILLNIANCYVALGNTTSAEAAYREIIAKTPNGIGAYIGLANLHMDQKNYAGALEYYQKALSLNQNDPILHNNIGNAYYYLNDIQSSNRHYKRAIEIKGDYIDPYQNLLSNHKEAEQIDQARGILRQLIKILKRDQKFDLVKKFEKELSDLSR